MEQLKSLIPAQGWFYAWLDAGGAKLIKPIAAFGLDSSGQALPLVATEDGRPGGLKQPHVGSNGFCIHESQLTEAQRASLRTSR